MEPLRLDRIEYHRPQRSYGPERPHRHDWHEMIVLERGRYRATGPGTGPELELRPGQWTCWPAGMDHEPRISATRPERDAYYYLAWTGGPALPGGRAHDDPQRRLLVAARWLYDVRHRDAGPAALTRCLLRGLVEEARWLTGPGGAHGDDRLERARHFIMEHVGKDLAVAMVAEAAGMSLRHFQRSFRERYGTTPKAYQLHLRDERALDLLANTDLDLDAIAAEVAMPGASYLCRRIKRITGRTPGELRRPETARSHRAG